MRTKERTYEILDSLGVYHCEFNGQLPGEGITVDLDCNRKLTQEESEYLGVLVSFPHEDGFCSIKILADNQQAKRLIDWLFDNLS